MLINLMYGLPVMALCLILQGLLASLALGYYSRRGNATQATGILGSFSAIVGVMFILVIGNVLQVVIWGLLFVFLGEFASIQDAIYHSAVNFATLGYGDIVMSEKHRLLGPLESINGVLMIGVSSAVLMTAFQDTMKKIFKARGE
jgi:hypothetical protein